MSRGVHKIWPQWPAITLTFDLQNIIRSSVGASEYSLTILPKLFKPFMRYCVTDVQKIWPQWPPMTLTFDLQNPIMSSVGASEYSQSVLPKQFKPFMRYCVTHVQKIWPRWPAMTLTFDLQNIIRSLVEASEYSKFYPNFSSRSWDIVVTMSDRTNGQMGKWNNLKT